MHVSVGVLLGSVAGRHSGRQAGRQAGRHPPSLSMASAEEAPALEPAGPPSPSSLGVGGTQRAASRTVEACTCFSSALNVLASLLVGLGLGGSGRVGW